ncbi:MAG: hypothetical protein WDN09_04390 [bacterium]
MTASASSFERCVATSSYGSVDLAALFMKSSLATGTTALIPAYADSLSASSVGLMAILNPAVCRAAETRPSSLFWKNMVPPVRRMFDDGVDVLAVGSSRNKRSNGAPAAKKASR